MTTLSCPTGGARVYASDDRARAEAERRVGGGSTGRLDHGLQRVRRADEAGRRDREPRLLVGDRRQRDARDESDLRQSPQEVQR